MSYKIKTTLHKLSHQHIKALFILKPTLKEKGIKGLEPINLKDLNKIPLPILIKNYIEEESRIAHSF
jgi:hypothetical protein